MEDARQIREDLVKFFKLLKKWDRKAKQKQQLEDNQGNKSNTSSEEDLSSKPGMTTDKAVEGLEEVLHPRYTSDGENITCSADWPEEESDSKQEPDVTTRLIDYFEKKFGKKLTENEAREMLNFLSEDN